LITKDESDEEEENSRHETSALDRTEEVKEDEKPVSSKPTSP